MMGLYFYLFHLILSMTFAYSHSALTVWLWIFLQHTGFFFFFLYWLNCGLYLQKIKSHGGQIRRFCFLWTPDTLCLAKSLLTKNWFQCNKRNNQMPFDVCFSAVWIVGHNYWISDSCYRTMRLELNHYLGLNHQPLGHWTTHSGAWAPVTSRFNCQTARKWNEGGNNSQQVLFIHPKTKRSNFSHYIQILHTVLVHLITSFVHKKNIHKNVNLCIQKIPQTN